MWVNRSPQSDNYHNSDTLTVTKVNQIRRVLVNVRFDHFDKLLLVLTNWTFHQQTTKKSTDKDFKELNRQAIKNKATTSDQQYNFRQSVNLRLKDPAYRR